MENYLKQAEKLADDTVRNLKAEPELIEKIRNRVKYAYWCGIGDRNNQAKEDLNKLKGEPTNA